MSTTIEVKCATCGFPCDPKCDMYDEDSHEWFHIGNRCGTTPIELVLSAGDSLAEAARKLRSGYKGHGYMETMVSTADYNDLLAALAAWDAARKR